MTLRSSWLLWWCVRNKESASWNYFNECLLKNVISCFPYIILFLLNITLNYYVPVQTWRRILGTEWCSNTRKHIQYHWWGRPKSHLGGQKANHRRPTWDNWRALRRKDHQIILRMISTSPFAPQLVCHVMNQIQLSMHWFYIFDIN